MDKEFDLEDLLLNKKYRDPVVINPHEEYDYSQALSAMLLIRAAEVRIAKAKKEGIIGGPVHLGVGQEAIAVGVSSCLKSSDRVFGAHRSHSHIIALGTELRRLFAEILGRRTGLSKGMGGSMHLWDGSIGFYGSVPIVAGTVPLAVGAGMAARLSGCEDIAVAYFGDGACEEGIVHESINLAAIQKDPVLFVVENNLFASHMHMNLRQTAMSTARFAKANNISYRVVDGNNIKDVKEAASELVGHARTGHGPGFLEAITYRWYGHVDWRDDVDVGVNRSAEDISSWKKRDPIARLRDGMINAGIWTSEMQDELNKRIELEVDQAWLQALKDDMPDASKLEENVYV